MGGFNLITFYFERLFFLLSHFIDDNGRWVDRVCSPMKMYKGRNLRDLQNGFNGRSSVDSEIKNQLILEECHGEMCLILRVFGNFYFFLINNSVTVSSHYYRNFTSSSIFVFKMVASLQYYYTYTQGRWMLNDYIFLYTFWHYFSPFYRTHDTYLWRSDLTNAIFLSNRSYFGDISQWIFEFFQCWYKNGALGWHFELKLFKLFHWYLGL